MDPHWIIDFLASNPHLKLVRRLGNGGSSNIFLARTATGEEVAVKILLSGVRLAAEKKHRFEEEFRALQALNHPNIVRATQFGVTLEGNLYFLLEYLPGGSLLNELERHFAIPLGRALYIALEVAKGLESAHHHHFIHRDIKPSNILIGADPKIVKIGDFGLVKDLDSEGITRVGTVLGSYGYMSYEQLSSQATTLLSDIYSLGVVLFTTLSGRLPFPNDSSFFYKIVNEELPIGVLERRAIPPDVVTLVHQMTARNPNHRPPNMGSVIEPLTALEKKYGGIPIPPSSPPPAGMVSLPTGRFFFGDQREGREIQPFDLKACPVTHGEYLDFLLATGHRVPEHFSLVEESRFFGLFRNRRVSFQEQLRHHPIFNVSHGDAEAYCRWAGGRLPTEEEWEYAAGGPSGQAYPWGPEFDPYSLNALQFLYTPGSIMTTPVDFHATGRSPFGLWDMVGNIGEWVRGHDGAVIKGGNYRLRDKRDFRVSQRRLSRPDFHDSLTGFRMARS